MQEDTFDVVYYIISLVVIIGTLYKGTKHFYTFYKYNKRFSRKGKAVILCAAIVPLVVIYLVFDWMIVSFGDYLDVYFHKIYILAISLYFTNKLIGWYLPKKPENIEGQDHLDDLDAVNAMPCGGDNSDFGPEVYSENDSFDDNES